MSQICLIMITMLMRRRWHSEDVNVVVMTMMMTMMIIMIMTMMMTRWRQVKGNSPNGSNYETRVDLTIHKLVHLKYNTHLRENQSSCYHIHIKNITWPLGLVFMKPLYHSWEAGRWNTNHTILCNNILRFCMSDIKSFYVHMSPWFLLYSWWCSLQGRGCPPQKASSYFAPSPWLKSVWFSGNTFELFDKVECLLPSSFPSIWLKTVYF